MMVFMKVFVQELGVTRMIEVYSEASHKLEAENKAETEFQQAFIKRVILVTRLTLCGFILIPSDAFCSTV